MSINYSKILELIAVEKTNEQTYLHIKLSFTQEIDVYWKVDNDTAESLNAICQFNDNHKYRLSLQATYDKYTNQYISYVTRTYLANSNRLNFTCSQHFKNELEAIKQTQSIHELMELPFISTDLSLIDDTSSDSLIPDDDTLVDESLIDEAHTEDQNQLPTLLETDEQENASNQEIVATDDEQQENSPIDEKSISEIIENETEQPEQQIDVETDKQEQQIDDEKKVIPKKNKLASKWIGISVASIIMIILIGYFSVSWINGKEDTSKDKSTTNSTQASAVKRDDLPTLELDELISFYIPKNYVALTFNNGPTMYTSEIADILNKYGVGGTFFFSGNYAKKNTDLVQYVHTKGYSIGSYGMKNVVLSNLSSTEQEQQYLQSTQIIENITKEKVVLFRPPYGLFNTDTQNIIQSHDAKIVLWNKDSEDWKTDAKGITLDFVKKEDSFGYILLLEETQETVDSLPSLIEYLQKQHFKIVNLK